MFWDKIRNIVEGIKEWVEFLSDRRYSWRFKIANLMTGDLLRNYLAVGCLVSINKIIENGDNPLYKDCVCEWAKRARDSIHDIMII